MYPVRTAEVIILDRVRADPLAAARLDRMMACIAADRVTEVDDAGLDGIAAARGWGQCWARRTGQYRRQGDPVLIFSTFRWPEQEELASLRARFPHLAAPLALGQSAWTLRDAAHFRRELGCVCQTAWEIHCGFGCLHACDYCHVPDFFLVHLNLEELARRVRAFGDTIPEQQLYKFDNYTDTICLEPEYGASSLMVPLFANWPGRYLLLYTKSDNVDHLLGLPHQGHTIINWSLSSETVASRIEKRAPSVESRIRAIERCQAAGYVVRVRISPVCPVRNWREEYREMIRRLLSRVWPDVITMDVVGWVDPAAMKEAMDTSLFDSEYVAALDGLMASGFRRTGKHVFPHEARLAIYRFLVDEIRRLRPGQRVSICNETVAMWDELGPVLGMRPDRYVCCCGPTSVPGDPLLGG